jgi:hypothetical protein
MVTVFEDPNGTFSFDPLLPLFPTPEDLAAWVFVEGLFSLSSSIFSRFTLTPLFLTLVFVPLRIDDDAGFNTLDIAVVEVGFGSVRAETRGLRLGED